LADAFSPDLVLHPPVDLAGPLPAERGLPSACYGFLHPLETPTLYVSLGTVAFFNQPSRFQQLLAELVEEDIELVVTISELHEPDALGQLPPTAHAIARRIARCAAALRRW